MSPRQFALDQLSPSNKFRRSSARFFRAFSLSLVLATLAPILNAMVRSNANVVTTRSRLLPIDTCVNVSCSQSHINPVCNQCQSLRRGSSCKHAFAFMDCLVAHLNQRLLRCTYMKLKQKNEVNFLTRPQIVRRITSRVTVDWARVRRWLQAGAATTSEKPGRGFGRRDWQLDACALDLVRTGKWLSPLDPPVRRPRTVHASVLDTSV